MDELRKILERSSQSGKWGSSELLPLVYDELRSLALRRIDNEKDPQSLQATALVHDAWLSLGNHEQLSWDNRRHFYRAAARVMRNILVDRARAKNSQKRGNRPVLIEIEKVDVADTSIDERVLLVDEMLTRLEADDPMLSEMINTWSDAQREALYRLPALPWQKP